MSQKFFKVILDGKSATRGEYKWNLPIENKDGTWTPGDWHSVKPPVEVPYNALHVTDSPREWWKYGADCYEVETAGEESKYDSGMFKKGVEKCRLLRKLTREELAKEHNIVIVKDGESATVVAGQICFAYGNSTVRADGNSTVRAYGNSTVRAYGNSTVRAYGNSKVEAYGNSTVEAVGNSTVRAYGNSTVRAYGNSTVEAYGNSTVEADGNSTVEAYGNSTVEADGNSTVRAYGNSTVRAYGNSKVEACGNSTVEAYGNSKVEAYGNSTVNQFHRYFGNDSKVTVNGDAVCIDRRSGKPEVEVAK